MTPKPSRFVTAAIAGTTQQRVEVRALQPFAQGRLGPVAEDVVGADDVGEEHRVEPAVLEDLGELGPVLELVEPVAVVAGQRPEPVRDVADAGHLEQVEDERLRVGHAFAPCSCGAASAATSDAFDAAETGHA